MENVVAARRLRKSALKELSTPTFNSLGNIGIGNDIFATPHIHSHNVEDTLEEKSEGRKFNFKIKLIIKVFIACVIVFISLTCKLIFKEQIKNAKFGAILINEYNKDYTKFGVLEKVEDISKSIYSGTKFMIPENLANYISSNYVSKVKPKLINFDLKASFLGLIKKDEKIKPEEVVPTDAKPEKIENKEPENTGIGGGEPKEADILEEASAVSMMQDDIAAVLAKNINIKKPVSGTITSEYGARDEIFDGVNGYHTGLDIANKKGVQVMSATDGVVTKIQEKDKYYGNNIEIEIDGITFKYAHLSKIEIKKGDKIKQGQLIGLMGDTGMVTGPHLHWEIKIDSRTVDPRKVASFY